MVILFIHLTTLSCWVFRLFLITYINNAELNKLRQIFAQIPDCLIRETLKSGNNGSNSSTFLKIFFLSQITIPETVSLYIPSNYIYVFPVNLLLIFCLVFTGALLSFFFTWKGSLHIRHMTFIIVWQICLHVLLTFSFCLCFQFHVLSAVMIFLCDSFIIFVPRWLLWF